jgi:Uma2 family endonuclease
MELALDLTKRYSYADYLTWWDGKRRELRDGFVHLMSPAARTVHARIVRRIDRKIDNYIVRRKGLCEVFTAPFDVRLPKNGEKADEDIYTVVQPDICVICDPEKIDEKGCIGAPDMVVEVLSPGTKKYDLNDKYHIYESCGVKEYWVVDPYSKDITVFILGDDGKYQKETVYELITDSVLKKVPVRSLPELEIELDEVFQ